MTTNIEMFKHFGIAVSIILLISSIRNVESFISSVGYYLLVLWISWQFTKIYRNYRQSKIETVDPDRKAVLITGCDTGFGNILAQELDSKGFTVFASCLNPESRGALHLMNSCSKSLKVFKLDVTQDQDVREAVDYVKNNLKENKLWAVVNNAAILHYLPLEWGPEGVDIYSKQMDVNVLGAVRVTKAFLPLLRESKNSRIINMGSAAGRVSYPGISSYAMTKFALRAFNESIRNEVKHFDINVILIEPTIYSTHLTDYNLWIDDFQTKWKETPEDVRRDYGPEKCDIMHERINAVMSTAKDNYQDVICALIDSIRSTEPKPQYNIYGFIERVLITVHEILPPEFFDLFLTDRLYFPIVHFLKNKDRI